MNELANLEFNVVYTPSEITIQNEEQLKMLVDKTTKHYESLVFDNSNIPEAKKARADLNKVAAMLDDQRKAVKKSYNEPLKAFEDKMKGYTSQIKATSNDINQSVQAFEDKEKEKRLKKINELIDEMSPNYEVEAAEVEVNPSWLNATSFTTRGEPNRKTLETIAETMTFIATKKKRIADDKAVVANYAKAVGLDMESWINLVDHDKTTPEIMKEMDKAVVARREREESEERERAQREEYEEAMRKLREQQVDDVLIDSETGEVLNNSTVEEKEEMITVTLKLTAPESKLRLLNQYIIDNGIGVEAM